MVRKEVELLGAVGVGVCAEYGSLVHKHVEEAANSHFLHEISWDMAHSFSSIKALQHITISTEPQCWKNLWIWRICIWRIGSRRSISRSRSWVGNDGSSRGRGHPEGSQVRASWWGAALKTTSLLTWLLCTASCSAKCRIAAASRCKLPMLCFANSSKQQVGQSSSAKCKRGAAVDCWAAKRYWTLLADHLSCNACSGISIDYHQWYRWYATGCIAMHTLTMVYWKQFQM